MNFQYSKSYSTRSRNRIDIFEENKMLEIGKNLFNNVKFAEKSFMKLKSTKNDLLMVF